ncbi:hypothetical protein CQ13_04215 [Bradyrhizobium retamae]|uniref:Uncharacterized protein n=1 Tax=Bradyrhizobium retamae TaxID=1300035 RepID=A0A0R3NBB9_9BRAD|nr:hypothetical protein CQ13_04215 [Bradyrhizobium retamae]
MAVVMRHPNLIRAAVLGLALALASALSADQVPLAFSTRGGDAWDFYRSVDVIVPAGRCDHIAISSPLTTAVLPPDRGQVHIRVPLQPGENEIKAECREHGVVQGAAQQNWHVRLRNVPTTWIHVSESSKGLILDAQASAQAPIGGSAITSYEWRTRDSNMACLPACRRTIRALNCRHRRRMASTLSG